MDLKGNKYFYVSYEKEVADSKRLIELVRDSGWVSPELVLVNCSPDYSSRLTQLVNHKLSYLNKHELYESLDMQMPYPTMSQVWSPEDKAYQAFDKYLLDWVRTHITGKASYLFVDSGTLRGKNFTKVRSAVRHRLEDDKFRFASLYVQDTSIFTPDFYVEKFDKDKQGGLLFQWEDIDNPNWDY